MPISQQLISLQNLCSVSVWQMNNRGLLAEMTASIVVGYYTHVESLLRGRNPHEFQISFNAKQKAIDYLTLHSESDRWHRDGWMFQIISWITARKFLNGYIGNPPHPKPANHGLDGLWVLSQPDGAVSHVIICEDKATDNPRKTIREQVWPEFLSHESGEKDAILINNLQSLLSTNSVHNLEEVISGIMLRDLRRYRVSITTENGLQLVDLERLFKGYEINVSGPVEKRDAVVFPIDNMRDWMDVFAVEVIQIISRYSHYV